MSNKSVLVAAAKSVAAAIGRKGHSVITLPALFGLSYVGLSCEGRQLHVHEGVFFLSKKIMTIHFKCLGDVHVQVDYIKDDSSILACIADALKEYNLVVAYSLYVEKNGAWVLA